MKWQTVEWIVEIVLNGTAVGSGSIRVKSSKGQVGQGEVGVTLFFGPTREESGVCCRSSPRGEQADPRRKQV